MRSAAGRVLSHGLRRQPVDSLPGARGADCLALAANGVVPEEERCCVGPGTGETTCATRTGETFTTLGQGSTCESPRRSWSIWPGQLPSGRPAPQGTQPEGF